MRSVCSRSSDPSTWAAMFAADSPPSEPTLVAMTSWSRLPRAAIHSPMIRSDVPMFGRMYVSAVSMKLPPAST